MEKEFVPYEQALALKELGFDEPCIAFYEPGNNQVLVVGAEQRYNNPELLRIKDFCAPLYQQAFRWFREKYNLKKDYGVFPHHTIIFNYILNGGNEKEAELECLKKLIEIVKEKKL